MGTAAARLPVLSIVPGARRRRPLSPCLRPSAGVSFAVPAAVRRFLEIPGPFGTIRAGYGWHLTHSATREEFMSRARAYYAQVVRPFEQRGATVLAGLAGTPRWLSPAPADVTPVGGSGWPRFATLPPTDPEAWAKLAAEVAQLAGERTKLEIWNEPEHAGVFWNGSTVELFELARLTAAAVRAAGRPVGGLAFSSHWAPKAGDADRRPLLERYLETHPEVDFVSYHSYHRDRFAPEVESAAEQVRDWAERSGMDPELPQYITEWQRWTTFPKLDDPSRDTELGAAYHAQALHTFARAGIAGATVSCLEGYHRPAPVGAGSFGILACEDAKGERIVEKPSFRVQEMLGELGAWELGANLPPPLYRAGVDVIATERASIVYRCDWSETPAKSVRFGVSRPGRHALEPLELAPFEVRLLEA